MTRVIIRTHNDVVLSPRCFAGADGELDGAVAVREEVWRTPAEGGEFLAVVPVLLCVSPSLNPVLGLSMGSFAVDVCRSGSRRFPESVDVRVGFTAVSVLEADGLVCPLLGLVQGFGLSAAAAEDVARAREDSDLSAARSRL
jgi:hypothetical protein